MAEETDASEGRDMEQAIAVEAEAAQVAPRFFTMRNAAAYSGLSVRTLERAVRQGELTLYRVGRRILIDLVDLDQWVRRSGETERKA